VSVVFYSRYYNYVSPVGFNDLIWNGKLPPVFIKGFLSSGDKLVAAIVYSSFYQRWAIQEWVDYF